MPQLLARGPTAATAAGPASGTSSSAPPIASAAARGGPKKIINDAMEFTPDDANALLSDTNDFTVIGVIGAQGVGKSTLMSLLAGARWGEGGSQLHEPPFAPQTAETVQQAAHRTCGCDLYVTPERLLLLDTQPLLSPSVLLELMRRETTLTADVQTHENLLELHSLRIALLVLSACHLVVCVHDGSFDPHALRMVRLAQTLRHRVPDLSVLAQATPAAAAAMAAACAAVVSADESPAPVIEYAPRLAFVFNRMPPDAFDPGRLATIRAVLTRLFVANDGGALGGSGAGGGAGGGGAGGSGGGGSPAADGGLVSGGAGGENEVMSDRCSGGGPEVFCLPNADAGGARLGASHLGYHAEAEGCRDSLLSLRRRPFAHAISEKLWLRGVGRMWDLLRRAATLADYNKAAQKMHLYA